MKAMKKKHLFSGIIILILTAFLAPSCATSNQARLDTQRKGLMMQDKSEYKRNKSHFKKSKAFKAQKKRKAYYQGKKRR